MEATSPRRLPPAADAAAVYVEAPPEYMLQQDFPLDIELTSSVFNRIRRIPIEYTCAANYYYPEAGADFRYGEDKSPPLAWTGVPQGAKSLAIVVDDPDAMTLEKGITAPRVPLGDLEHPPGGDRARGASGDDYGAGVGGSSHETGRQRSEDVRLGRAVPAAQHHLDTARRQLGRDAETARLPLPDIRAGCTELDVAAGATKNELLEAMEGHVLAGGELKGEYVNKRSVQVAARPCGFAKYQRRRRADRPDAMSGSPADGSESDLQGLVDPREDMSQR